MVRHLTIWRRYVIDPHHRERLLRTFLSTARERPSVGQLARSEGVGPGVLRRALAELGYRKRPRKAARPSRSTQWHPRRWSDDDIAAMAARRAAGESLERVALHYGVSRERIRQLLARRG